MAGFPGAGFMSFAGADALGAFLMDRSRGGSAGRHTPGREPRCLSHSPPGQLTYVRLCLHRPSCLFDPGESHPSVPFISFIAFYCSSASPSPPASSIWAGSL